MARPTVMAGSSMALIRQSQDTMPPARRRLAQDSLCPSRVSNFFEAVAFLGVTVGVSLRAGERSGARSLDLEASAPMPFPASAGFACFRLRVLGGLTVSREGSVQGTGFLMETYSSRSAGRPRSVIS